MARAKCEDMEIYEEIRAGMQGDGTLLYDAVSLGIFTEAHRALRKSIYEESRSLSTLDIEEFAERVSEMHAAMHDYELLIQSLNASLQPAMQKSALLENGDVLDNAFANFLKSNTLFTLKDLISYFEEKYSEKKLVKYVGSIPIYKKTIIFSRDDIESRLLDLLGDGIVFRAGPGASRQKGKKREKLSGASKDEFISMPVVYAIFGSAWNPLAAYPEAEGIAAESMKVISELMSADAEPGQAGKMLKLLFKNSDAGFLFSNLAGMLSMYYEQMGEHRPEFIIEGPSGLSIAVGSHGDNGLYETVSA